MATKVVSITSAQTDVSAQSGPKHDQDFSLEQIENPQVRAEVGRQVQRIRESMRRSAYEVIQIGRALTDIKAQVPGHFNAVCSTQCGIDPRVARRIIAATQFAEARLAEHEAALEHLSPAVLYRLAEGGLSEAVVDELIGQAADGKRVAPPDLRNAIKRFEEEVERIDAEKEAALNEAADSRKALTEQTAEREKFELTVLRQQEQIERYSEAVEKYRRESVELVQEHAQLQSELAELKAHPQVVEKEVTKIPPGYSSVEAAIKDKEKRLRQVNEELSKAEAGVADARRELSAIQAKRASTKAGLEALVSLREEIQVLAAKYTVAMMISIAGDDAKIDVECRLVAAHLRVLADQIERRAPTKPKAQPAARSAARRR